MLDVDRRSFVSGIVISTLPVPALATTDAHLSPEECSELLADRLGMAAATMTAMTRRAQRFTGESTAMLMGSADGTKVELLRTSSRTGTWLIRGNDVSQALLADATAFICERAQTQLAGPGASFRWFSGCSFGGASAHLFRGNKSALFLVTRAAPKTVQPKRLDIVFA